MAYCSHRVAEEHRKTFLLLWCMCAMSPAGYSRANLLDDELVRHQGKVVVWHPLRRPDGARCRVVRKNMKHPSFLGIGDCQRLSRLS